MLHSVNSDLPVDHPTRVSPPEMVVGNLSRKASSVIRDPLQLCMNKVRGRLCVRVRTAGGQRKVSREREGEGGGQRRTENRSGGSHVEGRGRS